MTYWTLPGLRFLSSPGREAPLLSYPDQQCLFLGLLCKRACWPSPSARGTTFLRSWACASPTAQWRCKPAWATTSVPTQTSMKSNWRTWLDLSCGKLESRFSFRRGHTAKLLTVVLATEDGTSNVIWPSDFFSKKSNPALFEMWYFIFNCLQNLKQKWCRANQLYLLPCVSPQITFTSLFPIIFVWFLFVVLSPLFQEMLRCFVVF